MATVDGGTGLNGRCGEAARSPEFHHPIFQISVYITFTPASGRYLH